VSPTSGPAAGGTSVTITGTGFTGASAVNFGATPAASFTVNDDTSISATAPAHAAGTVDVTVATVGGTSATNANDQYAFVAAPAVTNVNPTSGSDAGGTSVTITGTGFTGASAVNFGGSPAASFTVNDDTSISATSPAHAAGTVDITVTTIGGTSATNANDQYTFVVAAPICSNPCLSVGDKSMEELDAKSKAMTFQVTLSQPATSNVTVDYTVIGGTGPGDATGATKPGAGADFKLRSGTLVFKVNASGKTPITKSIAVPIFGDTTVEPDETFTVVLSNASAGTVLGRGTGFGTILNDDGVTGDIAMGVGDGSIVVANSGAQSLKIPVTLSSAAGGTVTVDYTITPGSATYSKKAADGGDFGGVLTKTLTFLPGQTLKTIAIPIWPDAVSDTDESFTITLSNLNGAGVTIIRGNATGTILGQP
jgi:hypothetical protein